MEKCNPDFQEYIKYVKDAMHHCTGYQELHAHSEASFRDAVTRVNEFVDNAKKLGRQCFAITDHGNQMRLFHGIKARTKDEKVNLKKALEKANIPEEEIEKVLKSIGDTDSIRYPTDKMWPYVKKYRASFLEAAANSLQFISGIEAYFQPTKDSTSSETYHLILYAKDWVGQKELFKIQNLAQLNKSPKGMWNGQETGGLPRTTWEDLERLAGPGTVGHGHIIATSACVGGYIPYLILRPWYTKEKQEETLANAQRVCDSTYEVADMNSATQQLEEAQQELALAKQRAKDLKQAQKLAANDGFTRKETRLKKKLDKTKDALDNAKANSQESMFSDNDSESKIQALTEDYLAAKKEYNQFMDEQDYLKELLLDEKGIQDSLSKAEAALISAKSYEAVVTRALRPYLRYMEKWQALEDSKLDPEDCYREAVEAAKRMENIFGHENFFIELHNHHIASENYTRPYLYRLIQETGIEPTVANDVHYATKNDVRKRNLIAAMRFNTPVAEKEAEEGMDELYFKSNEEMAALCESDKEPWMREIWKQGMENTAKIANACNVYYKYAMHLPEFDAKAAGFDTAHDYLDNFCRKMIPKKYPKGNMSDKEYADLMEKVDKRLVYELGVIDQMGFNSYISIVQDFIFYGRKIGGEVAIGPGRGSAAGSIVCYLADITDVDPLRYELLFERFLNPARVSMPDIDVDNAPSVRGKVIEYVTEKYAYKEDYPVEELRSTVCNIVTESQLAAKGAIRNVARVTGLSLELADKVAKLVPTKPKMTIQKALDESQELQDLVDSDPVVKKLIEDSLVVEGVPVQTGVHAAGVIIADKPVSEYSPLLWNDDMNCWVIESNMVDCEKTLGLLKMDFLGLENLDIINTAIRYIARTRHKMIHLSALKGADDREVIDDIYAKGATNGIFQFESAGMKKYLISLKPTSIDDIILMNAAYRPGPMDSIPDVIKVKQGQADATYIIPEMENVLGVTYGNPIYQEQIMQLFQMVGFSLGEADIIRRAMSKKHLDEIEAAKDKFVNGMLQKNADPVKVEEFWQRLLAFASYA